MTVHWTARVWRTARDASRAVGTWHADFSQTPDDEVVHLRREARRD